MNAIIILAAGASVRLGTPKQRLLFRGKSLLLHAIHEATATGSSPVIVVLGANALIIRQDIELEPVHIVYNPEWEAGMGTSIYAGMKALSDIAPRATSVLLMLCDQPFADRLLLSRLLAKKEETGRGIAAAAYATTLGAPVLLDQRYFNDLRMLQDGDGAKPLLNKYSHDVTSVAFPAGIVDIDTAADYAQLVNQDNCKNI